MILIAKTYLPDPIAHKLTIMILLKVNPNILCLYRYPASFCVGHLSTNSNRPTLCLSYFSPPPLSS